MDREKPVDAGILGQLVLSQIPRILGLCDRQPDSPHQGCFDRLYWNYRIADFPSIWMQDGSLLLALLYGHSFAGNLYHQKGAMREWAQSAINFWVRCLHRDGSGDEVYPYERSFCATAFSACAATEALMLLEGDMPERLAATGPWLGRRAQSEAANQLAAASLALYNIALLGRDAKMERASEEVVLFLLDNQDGEGYFPEYGGCDIGYLSITLSFLAQLHRKNGDSRIWEGAQRALAFLENKIREDGTFDYHSGSRQTQYLYPFGFAYFASPILERMVNGLRDNQIVNPAWMDDRYVIPMTLDYLKAHLYLDVECP